MLQFFTADGTCKYNACVTTIDFSDVLSPQAKCTDKSSGSLNYVFLYDVFLNMCHQNFDFFDNVLHLFEIKSAAL